MSKYNWLAIRGIWTLFNSMITILKAHHSANNLIIFTVMDGQATTTMSSIQSGQVFSSTAGIFPGCWETVYE